MKAQKTIDTARALVAGDKGLLAMDAMDESTPTCDKRFAKLSIPQTEEARRACREPIVSTPGLCESISSAILYDETIRQRTKDGTPLVKVIIGEDANIEAAQQALQHRARCNRAARSGEYHAAMEGTGA